MQPRIIPAALRICVPLLFALAVGCSTLEYRSIQSDFVNAVAADNVWSASPIGTNASQGLYEGIRSELTEDCIKTLDVRLQPNAWMLRAVSEWRLGNYPAATEAASKGRAAVETANQSGSRDHVMLAMLDGFVIVSDLHDKYRALPDDGGGGRKLDLEAYRNVFHADFVTALSALDGGFKVAGGATPPEIVWYAHFHRWRLISNWRTVVNDVDDDAAAAAGAAEAVVKTSLKDAMKAERDLIPNDHPLRQLIVALGG